MRNTLLRAKECIIQFHINEVAFDIYNQPNTSAE